MAARCKARSKTSGQQCRRTAIPGGTVCYWHGGAAGQVQAAARLRLAALVEPALTRLEKLLRTKQQQVALGAVKDVLDRNGLRALDDATAQVSARQGPSIIVVLRNDVSLPGPPRPVLARLKPEGASLAVKGDDHRGLPNVVLRLPNRD